MLTVDSQTPITVTQGDSTTTYGKWIVASAQVTFLSGKVKLLLVFKRCDVDGNFYVGAGGIETLEVDDILTDSDLATNSAAFFQALVTKAFAQGIIT